jgi:transposase
MTGPFEQKPAHRRHDLDDRAWGLLEPHLPGRKGAWGGIAQDNRLFLDAVFWILRTGAPWRDLPPDYGDWKNTHRRFCRWRDKGQWESLLEVLLNEPGYEWLMIDAGHCKVHPDAAAGARGGNQAMSRTKGGLKEGLTPRYIWPWMRMVCRSEWLLQRVPVLTARRLAH